jgi:hypothetical protein
MITEQWEVIAMNIPNEMVQDMKKLIMLGREHRKIHHFHKAFEMHPVEEEIHKGRIEYWTDPEGWEKGNYRNEV